MLVRRVASRPREVKIPLESDHGPSLTELGQPAGFPTFKTADLPYQPPAVNSP